MRAVARKAGVDPSLPRHYFPTKSALFIEALGPIDQIEARISAVVAGPPDAIGDNMVRNFLALWDSPEFGPRLHIVLSSALATPEIAAVAKGLLYSKLFLPIASSVPGDDPPGRAAAAMSQAVGLAASRYLLKVEPIASASADELVARFGPVMQRHITGRFP